MKRFPLVALLCLSLLPLAAGAAAHPFLAAEGADAAGLNLDASETQELFSESDADLLEAFDRQPDLAAEQALAGETGQGAPQLVVRVSKKTQTMAVEVNGSQKFSGWKVSTGKAGFETRSGTFTPFEMNKNYFSRQFHVILPYGIKFDGGNLIHAASAAGQAWLGQKHSHGCVRLHPAHAKTLYEMVSRVGMRNTRVIVF